MSNALVAYHGDKKLKAAALRKVRAHQKADRIIQRTYWSAGDDGVFRGCAVGCLLEDPDGGHQRYETEFGIPEQLAWLEDGIFEGLPANIAKQWPARFMAAIQPGTDLAPVWPRFAVWLMADPEWGLEYVTEAEDVKAVCRQIAAAYTRIADGDTLTEAEEQAVTDAAWAAWAAWDAWDARDAWAAWDARDAWAAWAARDAWGARAARGARDAWGARGARDAFNQASADKLIELLAAA